jgi:hypothetical protein
MLTAGFGAKMALAGGGVSGHPKPAREGRLKTGQGDGRVRESYAGGFSPGGVDDGEPDQHVREAID